MYAPFLVTAPAASPVDLDVAKAHLRVDGDEEDILIQGLIDAAVSYIDGWTGILGRCICEQVWRQDFDRFSRALLLPLQPVMAVVPDEADETDPVGISYTDPNGENQSVAGDQYQLLADASGSYVRFNDSYAFPATGPDTPVLSVTYRAGSAPADVPAAIKAAILLMVGHWYANREAVVTGTIATELPMAAAALLAPFRRVGL